MQADAPESIVTPIVDVKPVLGAIDEVRTTGARYAVIPKRVRP